ncbi:MAG: ABC transporter substrate-binding protein [Bdellovibrionales bacterium]|nr:ABC transporter substrate-binding protein [Bdellovibrionales bacterium]
MKIFLILWLALTSLNSFGNSVDLKKIELPNNRTIIVTGHPVYPPVIWATPDGKELQGVGVELIRTIFKEINVNVIFKNVETWGRAQEEVKNGRIDMLLPPYKTNDRLALYNYSANAFMMDETAVFVKKGREFPFESFKDLLNYKGTAIINDSFGSLFDEFDKKNGNITRLPTTEQCFRFVEKDRARFVIAGVNSGFAALTKLKQEKDFVILPKRIIATGLYAPIALKSKWNTPEINAFLKKKFEEYNQNGTIKVLEKKYISLFREENAKQPLPKI